MTTPKHMMITHRPLTKEFAERLRKDWERSLGTGLFVLTGGEEFHLYDTESGNKIYPPTPPIRLSFIPFTLAIVSILISVSAIVLALVAR